MVAIDDGGSGCDGIGIGCVLFSFISYVFKSSVYFKQCCNMPEVLLFIVVFLDFNRLNFMS